MAWRCDRHRGNPSHDISEAVAICHPLLELIGRSVDKQANRRTRSGPRATLNQDRLNGSLGARSFLKATVITCCSEHLCVPATFLDPKIFSSDH